MTWQRPERNWLGLTLACLLMGVPVAIPAAQIPPAPDNPLRAQTSLGSNLKSRCPDLRTADEGTRAVVVFWLPRSGVQSQVSLKSSSGSAALDSAAISCVARLRFAPATRIGDGDPIDSWQQIALRWANQGNADATRTTTSQDPLPGASRPSEPIAAAPAQTAANAPQQSYGGQADSVTVHVCVDATGRLEQQPTIVHSSGTASLDQAAVRIAASGSAYYRPETSSNAPPVSGCAQLVISFDTR